MIVLAVASLAGCGGSREAGLIGTWKINPASMNMPEPKNLTPQQKAGIDMGKQMMANASIELKQDKSFTMTMGMPMEGTWAFDEAASKVELTMTKMMGMDLSKMPNASKAANTPLVGALSADGKQLSLQPQGRQGAASSALTFVKQ